MSDQPSLFCNSRFDDWAEFHRDNPVVFQLFRKFAVEALNANRGHFGARMIGERIRWYCHIETTTRHPRINNNHWPYYARLLAGLDPRFAEWFEFRDSRFDASTAEIVRVHREMAA